MAAPGKAARNSPGPDGGWIAQAWAQTAPEPDPKAGDAFSPEQSKRAPEKGSQPTAQPEQGTAKVPAPTPPVPLPALVSPDLNDVVFIDSMRGWVVGDEGTILFTPDGGKTWTAPEYDRGLPPWYYASLLLCAGLLAPALRRPPPVDAATPAIEGAMASDRPMQAGDVDVLGLRNIAWALSRFLRNENTEAPLTVAVTGEWGTGKSSLMNALREDIVQYGVRPVLFNAWHHQKEEHLLASLLEAVRRQAIPPVTTPSGLLFRARLVWGRARRRPVSTLVLVALAVFFAGYLSTGFPERLTDIAAIASMPDLGDLAGLLLAGAAGLSPLIILLKALKPFGASPAALIANAASGLRQSSAESRTGFRDRFAAEFGEVTQALGARTMLIMIDDLDRCRPDSVLEVMEGINFLVSSGECFVVLGMARERVERAVGLSFREIAREMVLPLDESGNGTDKEAREREKEIRERHARWEYGRHYLEKLINIEIPVPVIRSEQAGQLLQAGQTRRGASLWKRGAIGTLQALAAGLVLLAAAVFEYGHGLPSWKPDTNREGVESTGTGAPAPSIPSVVSPPPIGDRDDRVKPPQEPPTRTAELIPGQKDSPGWSWMLAGFVLLAISAVALVLSRPHVVVRDSKSFRDALAIWDDVIASNQNTPRKLKRFMNRLRWLAMRTRKIEPAPGTWGRIRQAWNEIRGQSAAEAPGQIPEAVLVGLAAMRAADAVKDKNALQLAHATHAAAAGSDPTLGNWPPTAEQTALFEELSSAVAVS